MTDEQQKIIFSKNLSNILYEKGKSQAEAAKAIGVSPQVFNTWVRGIALPRMGKIQALADYFCVTTSALIDPPSPDYAAEINLTPSEQILVKHYRSADPGTKAAVNKLLDVLGEEAAGVSAG